MQLRPARPDDADAVAEAFIAAREPMTYLPRLHTVEGIHGFFRDIVLRDHEVWIAQDEGLVAGFAALGEETLEHLYVAPAHQDKGMGAALLERAKERRPRGFRFWVFQRNEGARRFYERHGCRLVRLTDGSANEEREPDALYEWRPAG
jgi:ribosomal protein S18 acetylase RimI-like enzyme